MMGLPTKYSVNLREHMAECDTNYLRLSKLMPHMRAQQHRQIAISFGAASRTLVTITVLDQARYTTTLTLYQSQEIWDDCTPEMTVRVYHDARMAEVIAYQHKRAPRAVYNYPNRRMHARDEKRQLNRLLGEWLAMCLVHGHEPEPVVLVPA